MSTNNNNDDNSIPDGQQHQQQTNKKISGKTREQRLSENNNQIPESLADTATHDQLVDNPIPYKPEGEENNNNDNNNTPPPSSTSSTNPQQKPKKKFSQMDEDERIRYIAKKKTYKFLVLNDDGSYGYDEKIRKTLNGEQLDTVNELGVIAGNFPRLQKETETDESSIYYQQKYYKYKGKKLYSHPQAIDLYFKTIIAYSFRISLDSQRKFALEDDLDEADNNDAFGCRTIGKVCAQVNNFSWAFFQST